jgi:8-oxo-dGTP pyrophosphatase MutT (NUDIX family)
MKTLKDSDVFKNPEYDTSESYEDRKTVKIIVKNNKEEIALITNPVHNFFLLPGGGAESDDLEKEAVREALEETGYNIEIIEKIAELEEFRNRNAKHYLTTCFVAKEIGKSDEDLRTEEEKENGLEVKWFGLSDALDIMNKQVEKVKNGEVEFYNTAFNIVRDKYFIDGFAKPKLLH